MSDELIADPSGLEKKDKTQLQAIITALGGKANSRQTKAGMIAEIAKLSAAEVGDDSSDDGSDDDGDVEDETESQTQEAQFEPAEEGNQRRGRRKGRGRNPREEAGNDPISEELQDVSGFLDLRDEGYGFLRVNGFLPSKDDVYVSVKQVRQLELRRGDHLAGKATPAHRNEKNPSFSVIETVNSSLPEDAMKRPAFEELTATYPTQQIVLESEKGDSPKFNRLIDLIAPIGKGQRCFLSGPSRSGRTSIVADIAQAVEQNYSEMSVLILSIDSRPEEVSYLAAALSDGEVIASTFDRPAEEHIATAELTLERAKRMAEKGEDVFIVVDSLTQLAKAYVSNFIQTSRSTAANVELPALAPVKSFLGGAINFEEAGSVTVVSVLTDSPLEATYLDSLIYSELRPVANSEVVLSDVLGGEAVIDVMSSGTSMESNMIDEAVVADLAKLRELVIEADVDTETGGAAGIAKLTEMAESKTNAEILAQITKTGSLL